jgi:hypothetical protein
MYTLSAFPPPPPPALPKSHEGMRHSRNRSDPAHKAKRRSWALTSPLPSRVAAHLRFASAHARLALVGEPLKVGHLLLLRREVCLDHRVDGGLGRELLHGHEAIEEVVGQQRLVLPR